jgi:GAF domain-containing protein/PAS domain-containing protein
VYNAASEVVASVVVFQDITERRKLEDLILRERAQLAEAMSAAKMVSWEFDVASGCFIFNDDYYAFLETTAAQEGGYLMPAPVFAERFVHPDSASETGMRIGAALAAQDASYSAEFEALLVLPNNRQKTVVVSLRIEQDSQGQTVRLYGSNQDITERKRADLVLEEQRQLLQQELVERKRTEEALTGVLLSARMGYWELDLASMTFTFNDEFYAMLRTTAEAEGGYLMPVERYAQKFAHPDDTHLVADETMKAIQTTDPNYNSRLEHRFYYANGEMGYLSVTISVVKDENGKTIKTRGANQDITERKRAEAIIAKRATELAQVAEISTSVSTIQNPDEMLQTVVDLTRQSFELYHAHIYLLDEAGESLVLTKGAGEIGQKMVAEKRRITIDAEKSLVARAARSRQGVIVNDVRQDPEFLPHPLLPETRSEMAVPMIAGDRLLGVIDIQDEEVERFTAEDVNIMTTLAAQVAVSLQNARSFARAQRQAEREALINAISERIQATNSVESALQVAVREIGRALGANQTAIRLGLERKTEETL